MKKTIILTFIMIVILWEYLVSLLSIPIYLLPPPSGILAVMIENYRYLLQDFIITMFESVVGFILAIIMSILFVMLISNSRTMSVTIMPFLIGLKAIPIIAIAPLLVIWFGNGVVGKAIMSAIISFFPIVVNLIRGLNSSPIEQIELLKSLGANKYKILLIARIPNALPYFISGLKISSTLSVVGAIVGETVGANKGLGHLLIVATMRVNTEMIFAGIILASVLGIVFYYSIEIIESKAIFWGKTND